MQNWGLQSILPRLIHELCELRRKLSKNYEMSGQKHNCKIGVLKVDFFATL